MVPLHRPPLGPRLERARRDRSVGAGAARLRPGSRERRDPAAPGRRRPPAHEPREAADGAPAARALAGSRLADPRLGAPRPELRALAALAGRAPRLERRGPGPSDPGRELGSGGDGHAPQLLRGGTLRPPGGEQARVSGTPVRDPRSGGPRASGGGGALVPARAGDRLRHRPGAGRLLPPRSRARPRRPRLPSLRRRRRGRPRRLRPAAPSGGRPASTGRVARQRAGRPHVHPDPRAPDRDHQLGGPRRGLPAGPGPVLRRRRGSGRRVEAAHPLPLPRPQAPRRSPVPELL